jgi:hypothetical protein
MENKIVSQVIGELIQDGTFPDWWNSRTVAIPLFENHPMVITFKDFMPDDDDKLIAEADEALKHFLALGPEYKNNISALIKERCDEVLNDVEIHEDEQAMRDITDVNDIWKFVHPSEIYVSRRARRDEDIYVQIACECDWEPEHGLQLVFRQGKQLTRVSEQDGHLTEADAWDKPDEEDVLLSQFRDN